MKNTSQIMIGVFFFMIRHVWQFLFLLQALFDFNEELRNIEFKIHYKSILVALFFIFLDGE